MTKLEKNQVIRSDIIKLDNEKTWINPTTSLDRKMALFHMLQDGFIIRPSYVNRYQSHVIHSVINPGHIVIDK